MKIAYTKKANLILEYIFNLLLEYVCKNAKHHKTCQRRDCL